MKTSKLLILTSLLLSSVNAHAQVSCGTAGKTCSMYKLITNTLSLGKIATTALPTCNTAAEGTVSYDTSLNVLKVCDGTNWTLSSAFDPETSTRITGVYVPSGPGAVALSVTSMWTVGNLSAIGGTFSLDTTTDTAHTYIVYTAAASTNSDASLGTTNTVGGVRWSYLPVFTSYVATGSSIAVMRYMSGLFQVASDYIASDTASTETAYFRYSTVAGDTKWKACSAAASVTATCTDTGVTVAINTAYTLKIDASNLPTDIKYYINGTLVVTKTLNLPSIASTVSLALIPFWVRTLENVAKAGKMRLALITRNW